MRLSQHPVQTSCALGKSLNDGRGQFSQIINRVVPCRTSGPLEVIEDHFSPHPDGLHDIHFLVLDVSLVEPVILNGHVRDFASRLLSGNHVSNLLSCRGSSDFSQSRLTLLLWHRCKFPVNFRVSSIGLNGATPVILEKTGVNK